MPPSIAISKTTGRVVVAEAGGRPAPSSMHARPEQDRHLHSSRSSARASAINQRSATRSSVRTTRSGVRLRLRTRDRTRLDRFAEAMVRDALIDALVGVVGPANVLIDADLRAGYETDWTGRFHGSARCVVRPASTDEVAGVVRLCSSRGGGRRPSGRQHRASRRKCAARRRGGVEPASSGRDRSNRRAAWFGRGRGGRDPRRGAHRRPCCRMGCRCRHGVARHRHDRRDGEHQRGRRARAALRVDARSGAGPRGGPRRRKHRGAHSWAPQGQHGLRPRRPPRRARRARWRSSRECTSLWSPTCPIESSRCAPSTASPTH